MAGGSVEIHCPQCQRDTLLLREPAYEGFTRVGETLKCAGCRHEFASEDEVPFTRQRRVKVFSDADRSKDIEVFDEGEADHLCRYCVNYVVNPFLQWCGHHRKEVEATDTCSDFERKPEEKKAEGDKETEKKPPVF